MKKFFAILLSAMLMLSLAVPAMAANVTVAKSTILENHTFTAYQIFSGREENGILSDVEWGAGINSAAFLDALKAETDDAFMKDVEDAKVNIFADCTFAANVANVLSANNTNTALANAVAKLAYDNKTGNGASLTVGTTELDDGYYLVVDSTVPGEDEENFAYNAALLQVVGDIDISVKTDVPTIDKVIVNADSDVDEDKIQDNADADTDGNGTAQDVGSVVEFKVVSKVPNMDNYESYTFVVNDTMSSGLTAVDGDDADDAIDVTVTIGGNAYTNFTVNQNGQSFKITFNNFIEQKDNKGKEIVITYSAIINENALQTNVETNTVNLEYSNNPNDITSKGETPDKTVYVYDFDIVIDKYTDDKTGDETDTRLSGAKFVLYKEVDGVVKYYFYNEEDNKVEWNPLAEGEELEDVLDEDYSGETKITEVVTKDGAAKFQGLDAGMYYLVETAPPSGYNQLQSPVEVEITAVYDADGTIKESSATTKNNGQYEQVKPILNNQGSTLPETGGMGTTIFYIVGGIMAVSAVVLLVTKKRMSTEG